MATHLDRILEDVAALRAEAVRISGHDHEPSSLATLLKDAGGTLETFIKGHVFPGRHDSLFDLINELAPFGVSTTDVTALHALRLECNKAKHDATYAPTVDEVVSTFRGVHAVLLSWRGRAIGTTENASVHSYRRRVWVAGWDHYIHGDGEVHVFAPIDESECDFPRGIDTIYVQGLAFPKLLAPLGGAVRPASGLVPQKFLDLWAAEGDFAGAYVFEGVYKDLLRVLVSVELRLDDLHPSLKRETDHDAMRTAVAFAAVDAVCEPTTPADEDGLRRAILVRALSDYAAPDTAKLSQRFATEMSNLLARIPLAMRGQINGPRFVASSTFSQQQTNAVVRSSSAVVSPSYELVLLLDNR